MIAQEPVKASIWHCLNSYAFSDATFLAERLYAEVPSEDILHLLATCYYRSGAVKRAYHLLETHTHSTIYTRYLLAKACYDLKKYKQAEAAIQGSFSVVKKTVQEITSEFSNIAGVTLELLGNICRKTDDSSPRAAECFKQALRCNPYLWSSFEALCQTTERVDPLDYFRTSGASFKPLQPTVPTFATTSTPRDVQVGIPFRTHLGQRPQATHTATSYSESHYSRGESTPIERINHPRTDAIENQENFKTPSTNPQAMHIPGHLFTPIAEATTPNSVARNQTSNQNTSNQQTPYQSNNQYLNRLSTAQSSNQSALMVGRNLMISASPTQSPTNPSFGVLATFDSPESDLCTTPNMITPPVVCVQQFQHNQINKAPAKKAPISKVPNRPLSGLIKNSPSSVFSSPDTISINKGLRRSSRLFPSSNKQTPKIRAHESNNNMQQRKTKSRLTKSLQSNTQPLTSTSENIINSIANKKQTPVTEQVCHF